MKDNTNSLPKWIIIVTGLFALLAFIVSLTLIISPQAVLDTVDINAKGADYLIKMWAVRQFTLGFIFSFSALRKSRAMIMISFIFFLVMNIGNVIVGFYQKDNGLIFGALVMCLISTTILYFMNRQTK